MCLGVYVWSTCLTTWFYLWSEHKTCPQFQEVSFNLLFYIFFQIQNIMFNKFMSLKDKFLTFGLGFNEFVFTSGSKQFSIRFYHWPEWGVCFYRGFFSYGAPVQQLLPTFPKTDLGHRGKTSCFILAALLLKDLEHSLSHLLPVRSPPSFLLPPLLFSSPQVLSDLSLGEKENACGSSVRCAFFAFVHVYVFLCMCTCLSALLSIQSCVCMCLHVTQCVLFKSTVCKALQGSLCIIGDLLLSAHCIWQVWIGDCHADMLINDNYNWYLLISKDEKSGITEKK